MPKTVMSGEKIAWRGSDHPSLLVDQITTMLQNECTQTCVTDYLRIPQACGSTTSDDTIDEQWRQKSAEWMFKVVDFYDLERDIVSIGMGYLDRMFSLTSIHHRWNKYQCRSIAMASLKLAIKLNEPRTLNMEDIIKLGMSGDLPFSSVVLIEMEYEILWKLSWNMFSPTAFCFAYHMICMMPMEATSVTRYTLQELTKYMTELAICVYSFVKYKASSKAFASILIAIESLSSDGTVSTETKETFLQTIENVFGLSHEDKQIKMIGKVLQNLLHHNTDLKEFINLIRASSPYDHQAEPLKISLSNKSLQG